MANKKITDVDVVSTVSDADYLFVNQGQSIKQIKKSDIPKPIYTAEEVGALPNTTIIPTTLPNPNALTFTGAATGSYDGSSPVEINIPDSVTVDNTLSVAGQAADAKATGDAISQLSDEKANQTDVDELKSDLTTLIDYNIIDNSVGIDNKVIGKDTSVFDDYLFAISNPFNVKKGQKVVVKAIGHANGTIIAMVDGNGYLPLIVTDETVYKEYSYVATKNMKLVICFRKSDSFYGFYGVPINDELAKVSGTPESFATQKELFDQWEKSNFGVGKNKFNKSSVTKGYAINTNNGELFESTDYQVSAFISVTENTVYYRNLESNIVFYDAMFNRISGIDFGTGTFTTPTNTAYIRISAYRGYVSNLQIEEGEVGTPYEEYRFYDDKVEQLWRRSQIRKPFPAKITPTMGIVGGNEISVEDKDKDGNLYATRWDNNIFKLSKGNDPYNSGSDGWTIVIDVAPFLNDGETISQYNMRITDTGRICVATNKGRVLVSDEEQTTFTEAFTFTNGFSQNTWGCDKYNKYVLFASYGFPPYGDKEPPHEVYLSSDYGATWNKIFDKPIAEMSVPDKFHIHDVAIDPFSEAIIVVTGDYENDRRIYYSYDFGVTWTPTNPNGEYCKIHPTSIVCMPKGIAFGSDDYPNEGIYWWERPYGVDKPEIKEDDIVCVNLFNVATNKMLTNCGTKGDYLITNYGVFGVIGFIQQNNSRTARLFVTGDGGVSWHEVFFEQGGSLTGFFGARLVEENGKVRIYANYGSEDGSYQLFVADMPIFYNE